MKYDQEVGQGHYGGLRKRLASNETMILELVYPLGSLVLGVLLVQQMF